MACMQHWLAKLWQAGNLRIASELGCQQSDASVANMPSALHPRHLHYPSNCHFELPALLSHHAHLCCADGHAVGFPCGRRVSIPHCGALPPGVGAATDADGSGEPHYYYVQMQAASYIVQATRRKPRDAEAGCVPPRRCSRATGQWVWSARLHMLWALFLSLFASGRHTCSTSFKQNSIPSFSFRHLHVSIVLCVTLPINPIDISLQLCAGAGLCQRAGPPHPAPGPPGRGPRAAAARPSAGGGTGRVG